LSADAGTGAVVRPTGLPTRSIGNAALWIAVFLGGFVFIEPSPYEYALAVIIPLWMLLGFRVPRALSPLVVLMILFLTGGILSAPQATNYEAQPIYIAVTIFLALSAIFFASLTSDGPDRMNIVVNAWIASALATSVLGILGYLGLTGELFVRYGRATGGFQDPNVFGPFLIFPFLILARRVLTSPFRSACMSGILALVIFMGIFLSFSRATWGITVLGVLAMGALLFTLARSPAMRMRFISVGAIGVVVFAVIIVAALSVPSVAELFETRAQVVQEYDTGERGRFARYADGFNLMLDHPLGIGAMEFGKLFGEDEHNIWLKVLTSYGWLGFAAFLTLVLWTIAAGFPLLFRASPILAATQVAYIVFVGHILMASIIDIDHWRHVYLLFGILWGAIAADSLARQRQLSAAYSRHAEPHRGGAFPV
jgi:O-antigen ligase